MSKPLSFLFGLEPTQAIEFLHNKKLLATKVFKKSLHDSAIARATTIARLSSLEMTNDIYKSMEVAKKEGKSFTQWKKDLVSEFEKKGWVFGHDKSISRGIDGKLLADPKTGEYFGTPRRLNTIYRTNVQAAYSAARYQRMMDNIDHRPYWQYSAVSDERTRPSHLALNGRIYRYDDPFWSTFYPPNGFNCRCAVIALGERDLKRKGLDKADDSSEFLVKVKRPADKNGNQEITVGFKLPDGSIRVADKGFDYNIGRINYRPNLDLYPEKLAHQFAKTEMQGAEFKQDFLMFQRQFLKIKKQLGVNDKLTAEQMLDVREKLSMNFKFTAGVLSTSSKRILESNVATVWFSDDSLIKQLNSRDGQDFDLDDYANIPDLIYTPDKIIKETTAYQFYKDIKGKRLLVVLKVLHDKNEIFIQSARRVSEKQWKKAFKK
ncbi:TPA: phage minor head protein [Pasteurella multocida]